MSSQQQQQLNNNKSLPTPLFIINNSKQITSLKYSRTNNNLLFVGTQDGYFYEYDLTLKRAIFTCSPCNQSLYAIIQFDLNTLFVYFRGGYLFEFKRFNTEWVYKCVIRSENFTFCKPCVLFEKSYVFIPSNESSIVSCFDLNTFELVKNIKPKSTVIEKCGMVMCLNVLSRQNKLLISYENGDISLFDLDSSNEISRLTVFNGNPLMSFDYSETVNVGIAASTELQMRQFRINDDFKLDFLNEIIELKNAGINCVKIRDNDCKIFVSGGWDSRLRVYSTKKGKLLCVLDFHKEAINVLDFSNDNNILAVGSNDGIISFWDLYNS